MERKSTYVAFSSQKDGAGKSAFTTLVASYPHYGGKQEYRNYPPHSIHVTKAWFPANKALPQGSNLDLSVDGIRQIINI